MHESIKIPNHQEMLADPLNLPTVFLPSIPGRLPDLQSSNFFKGLGFSVAMALVSPQEGEAQEYVTTPEDRSVAIEVMGESLVSRIEELGFTIEIQTKAPVGESYVIHIGQMHTAPGGVMNALMASGAVEDYQQRLDSLIPDLATVGSGIIFAEGISLDQDELEASRSRVRLFLQQIDELVADPIISYEQITDALDVMQRYQDFSNHRFIANTVNQEDIVLITEKIKAAITQLSEETEEERIKKEIAQTGSSLLGFGSALGILSDTSGQDLLARHYILGDITIAASESNDLNQQALDALENSREINSVYLDHQFSFLDTVEAQAIMTQLDQYKREHLTADEMAAKEALLNQLQAMYHEQNRGIEQTPIYVAKVEAERAFDRAQAERDAMVFEMIANYEQEYGDLGNVVVQYGNNHNFGVALAQYNLTHDGFDRGLIKLHAPE